MGIALAIGGGLVIRVAHVITKGDVGGAQTHVVELATAQLEAGDDVHVLSGSDGPAMSRLRAAGVQVSIVPAIIRSRSNLRLRPAVAEVRGLLSRVDPDVVHGHSSHAGLIARLASRRLAAVAVYTAHGWPFQHGAPLSQRVMSYAGEFVGGRVGDAVICLTDVERERALRAKIAPADRLWVVPNGLRDVEPDRRHRFVEGHPPRFVMVARFAPPKRQRDVVEAMAGLRDLAWSLAFVGDGPELADVSALGAELLGDRVEFLGHRDDVEAILADSDIALLWSTYEGLPMSVLEAMRAGLCCVGSDLPGIRELFDGDPSGGVVVANPDAWPATLRDLLENPQRMRSLGAAARTRYEDCYSAQSMELATRSVYRALLDARAGD